MKIVIDISEEQYEIIKELVKNQNSVCPEADSAEKIILNGTPLPKRHGRLKDEDEIVKAIEDRVEFLRKNDAVFMRLHKDIDILGCIPKIRCEVPTIIDADKADLPTYSENLVKESDVLVKENTENADKKGVSEETVSQSLVKERDLISRKDLLNAIWRKEYGKDYDGVNMLGIPHIDIIENMPSYNLTKTELNGDLISRKAVLNLRKYNLVGGIHTVDVAEIENLPTYPMGIQTKVFESAIKCCENVLDKMKDMSKEELLELARNPAERPTAELIRINSLYKCSNCGELICCEANYCPDCGAKIE